jgi:chemotaxis protein histidine kinase CheA
MSVTDTNEAALKEADGASLDARGPVAPFLVLESQGEMYAVRWTLVKEAGIVSSQDVDESTGRPEVQRNLISFPLCYLWELVGQARPKERPEEIAAVFLEEHENRMVLAPDRILWKQEADLRRLPQWLRKAPVVSGVISLASGVAVVVVEPFEQREHECACAQDREAEPTP